MFNTEAIIFYIVIFAALISACYAVTSGKSTNAIISSAVSFLCVGLLLFSLEQPMLGSVFIMLFAVILPLLFVITANHTKKDTVSDNHKLSVGKWFGLAGVFFIIFVISLFIKLSVFNQDAGSITKIMPSSLDISADMLVHYGVPIIFLFLLFTVAVIGADILIPVNERKRK